jgi:hypothetical protein
MLKLDCRRNINALLKLLVHRQHSKPNGRQTYLIYKIRFYFIFPRAKKFIIEASKRISNHNVIVGHLENPQEIF